jgi:hypothetical protein
MVNPESSERLKVETSERLRVAGRGPRIGVENELELSKDMVAPW